jgi:hypothetical protein
MAGSSAGSSNWGKSGAAVKGRVAVSTRRILPTLPVLLTVPAADGYTGNPRFNPRVTVNFSGSEMQMRKTIQSMLSLDHAPTNREIAALVGVLDDTMITIIAGPGGAIRIEADNPYYELERTLNPRSNDNPPYLYNDFFKAKSDAPKGIGARIVSRQASESAALGITNIQLHAAGVPGGSLNGYYTWPRLGFNNVDPADFTWLRKRMPEPLSSATDVLDLFTKPGGPEWWRENGNNAHVAFDTTPGSRSWQALNDYLTVKGIDPYAPFP